MNIDKVFFRRTLCLSGYLLLAAFVTPVWAVTDANIVKINYSGSVRIPPCTVITKNVAINLNEIKQQTIMSSGSVTDWNKGYSIELSGCESGSLILMSISGTPASNTAYFKNQGDAKNISVELARDDDVNPTDYSDGKTYSIQLPVNADSTTIPLKARLLNSGEGDASGGTVKSVVTATFSYK